MDGYLSGHSPVIQGGYKVTLPALPPRVVLADLDVLESAPVRLTRAGVGDVAWT
jgi:glycerol-1-phosphate dehydrogenase [NAD(P)+]